VMVYEGMHGVLIFLGQLGIVEVFVQIVFLVVVI
jgi:hypothetical protein